MTLRDKLPYFLSAGAIVLSILACGGDSEPVDPVDPVDPNEPVEMCGGIAGFLCSNPDDICVPDAGMCNVADGSGTCMAASEFCTKEYAPVCGCDGKTYGNTCKANQSGVGIDHEGACDASGNTCGTRGAGPCEVGEVCIFEEGANCGRTDLGGTCQVPPEVCSANYDPVCGCDGQTHSNSCFANLAGASVDYVGECQDEETACGGRLGDTCDANEFCGFALNDICGFADATSICQTRPMICTYEHNPVCGCDGKTYSNDCIANSAGTAVQYGGVCTPN